MSSLKQKLMQLRTQMAHVAQPALAFAPGAPVPGEARVERDDALTHREPACEELTFHDGPAIHDGHALLHRPGASAQPFASARAWPRRPVRPATEPPEHGEFDAETGEFVRSSPSWMLSRTWGSLSAEPEHGEPDALPGERVDTPFGPLRTHVARFDACHHHGSVAPALALATCPNDIALLALDPAFASVDLARALYLDTETTGLLGGTGTLPFLMGMAWFEGGTLHVEQLFLERPGEEGPMLERLRARIASASVLVSFNGKSFDWPLLRTRFVLARMPTPPLPPHLDLLHLARRVYKRRLGSVRLTALERDVLGFERVDDLDGALIPELYLGYLRGRVKKRALVPILDHNRLDLVALPALLGEIARRFRCEHTPTDARDALSFAAVSARADKLGFAAAYDQALDFVARSAAGDLRGEYAPEAHFLAGELQRKKGDLDAAVGSYRLAIEAACAGGVAAARAHLALAKLYEHKLRRLDHALSHAEHAAQARAEHQDCAARRLARLRDKLLRGEAPG